jgi:hypothetical protein
VARKLDTIKLNLRLPEKLHRRLTREAASRNRSLNTEIISRLQLSFSTPEQAVVIAEAARSAMEASLGDYLKVMDQIVQAVRDGRVANTEADIRQALSEAARDRRVADNEQLKEPTSLWQPVGRRRDLESQIIKAEARAEEAEAKAREAEAKIQALADIPIERALTLILAARKKQPEPEGFGPIIEMLVKDSEVRGRNEMLVEDSEVRWRLVKDFKARELNETLVKAFEAIERKAEGAQEAEKAKTRP